MLNSGFYNLHPIIHAIPVRIHETAQPPMPVRQKPQADGRGDAGQNQKLIPHHERRQHHQRQPPAPIAALVVTLPMSSFNGG